MIDLVVCPACSNSRSLVGFSTGCKRDLALEEDYPVRGAAVGSFCFSSSWHLPAPSSPALTGSGSDSDGQTKRGNIACGNRPAAGPRWHHLICATLCKEWLRTASRVIRRVQNKCRSGVSRTPSPARRSRRARSLEWGWCQAWWRWAARPGASGGAGRTNWQFVTAPGSRGRGPGAFLSSRSELLLKLLAPRVQ